MESSDKIQEQFGYENDHEYIARLRLVVTLLNKMVDEIESAQGNSSTLLDTFGGFLKASGLTENLDGGGHRLTNIKNGESSGDAVTLAQLTSQVQSGTSDPTTLPLTGFGVGTLLAGELVRRSANGNGLEGFDLATVLQDYASASVLATAVTEMNQTLAEFNTKLDQAKGLAVLGL